MAEETGQTELQQWPFPNSGLMLEYSPSHMPVAYLRRARNMYYPQQGILRSRAGATTLYNPTGAGEVTNMKYWREDGNLYWADNAGHLYKGDTEVTGPAENVVDMVAYNGANGNLLHIAEEKGAQSHTLHTYDGSAYSPLTGTDVPTAEKLMVRFSQLWATCNPDDSDKVYWSDYRDASTWTSSDGGAGFTNVANSYYGDIQDWIEWRENLYLAKNDAIYAILGTNNTNFRVSLIGKMKGIEADTFGDVVDGVLVATAHGVYPVARGYGGEPQDLTLSVHEEMSDFFSGAQGTYSERLGCYLLCNGSSTVWVSSSNLRPDVWTRFEFDHNITCIHEANNLYFGTDDGQILLYDTAAWTDDGEEYDVSIKTGFWNLGTDRIIKEIDCVEGNLSAREDSDVNVTLYTDGNSDTALKPGGWFIAGYEPQIIAFSAEARSIALELEYKNREGPAYFGGVALHTRGVRRFK